MTLYEIDDGIRRILENGFNGTVAEETGEIIEEGPQDLEQLQMERKQKLEAIALYIKNLEAITTAIKAEKEALTERIKDKEAKIERLKEYMTYSMTAAGEDGLETGKVAVSFRKSKAVIIDDEDKIDSAFIKETVKVTKSPDKTAIKKAIDAGQSVYGAHIEERKKVNIK